MDTIVTPVTVITLDSTRIVHSIKADLVARYFPPVVRLVQYDQSLPVIAVSMMQNGQTYTLPSGAAANIRVHKPDATYVYNPALGCDSTRNIVYFEVTQAMAAASGDGLAIVEIVVNGDIAGTSLITLHFEENPVPEDAIESSDEWETIYELGERIIASTVTPVSTAAGMTDHNVVYLYTGTESGWNQGHMYYYNGTTWVDAGIAVTDKTLTVEGLAADAKKTGEEIADLKDGLYSVESDLNDNIGTRLTDIDGFVVPKMEIGAIAFASTAIAYQNSNTAVRNPQNVNIRIAKGDVVGLTDYTNAKYKIAILKDSDGKYAYIDYTTSDYISIYDGRLYIVVAYLDGATVSNASDLSTLIRINKHTGLSEGISKLNDYQFILENNDFPATMFGNGEFNDGNYYPTGRQYRVSTKRQVIANYNVHLKAKSGFRINLSKYVNNAWSNYGWATQHDISSGIPFGFQIARTTETTSEIADINTFVSNIIVTTDFTQVIQDIVASSEVVVDNNAISTHMTRLYNSNLAESFVFFTDPHLMGSNGLFDETVFNNYIKVLKDTVDRVSASYVVCGGDWLNSGDTKAQASVKLGYVDGQMKAKFPDKYYPLVGNHDFNYLGVDGSGNRLSENDWISNHAMTNYWFEEYGECYYKFKKSVAQNYVLNTRTDYDGTGQYDKEMLDWLSAQLIEDDPEHSTILMHMYYLSAVGTTIPSRVLAVGKIIEGYNNHTVCTLSAETEGYDKTYDFSETTGHIDYVLVGHTHADFTGTFGGIPVIGCANFTKNDVATFDLIFADYTNGKLYTTRIGSGSSREFSI